MSLQDIVSLASSAVPGLEVGVAILGATYTSIENVKIYKLQCRDLSARCVSLMLSLRDGCQGLEGSKVTDLVDEITVVVERINRRVTEWAMLSRLRSFLVQREIKDGIDKLHRDIDGAMMKFSLQLNLELTRGHLETRAVQDRDKAEIRELLEDIIQSTDDMKALFNMHSSEPLAIMESLQTELRDSRLEPDQEQNFREGLWKLHQQTSMLPPLEDLTGQVTISKHTVAKGTFNDIYRGSWLDREPVALRLPRALANSPDVQRRFQREVAIWRSLKHQNVVQLYGIVYFGEDIYFVSPWMDNGTAIDYVRRHLDADRLRLLSEIAEGLEYLHLNGIVHGDLRGANVLIDGTGAARLSDFGLSKFLEDCGKGMTSSPGINPRWFAPELLRNSGSLSPASDVWSFGMVALELMTGEQPYSELSRDITVLRELDLGKIPDRPGRLITARGLSDDMWQLMKRCWRKKPDERLDMTTIKAKLAEIRRVFKASPSSPTGSFPQISPPSPSVGRRTSSIFSKRQPSDSSASVKSSGSGRKIRLSFMTSMSSRIPEDDQLSPISIRVTDGPIHSSPPLRSELSLPPETKPSLGQLESRRFSNASSPGLLPDSPHQLPPVSTSLPTSFGSHMPHSRPGSSSTDQSHSPRLTPRSSVSGSGSRDIGPLRQAVTDTTSVVFYSPHGTVQCGTLEGLIDKLLTGSSLRHEMEFREIFLTTFVDFTTSEEMFALLSRRFHQAEEGDFRHAQRRTEIQLNVFALTKYWVSNATLLVDPQLLWQMKEFCLSALSIKRSSAMNEKAKEILHVIDKRTNEQSKSQSTSPLSPGRRIPRTSEILPRDLAIALTLMEGDCYKRILPTDYLLTVRPSSSSANVDVASNVNNKITLWVKKSILHYDKLESRTEVLKFFINTAQECKKLRNFSSMTAIASALQSAPIERLRRTKEALPQHMRLILEQLEDVLDPTANHRTYRHTLNDVPSPEEKDICIPWTAVHLRELYSVLRNYPATIERDGRPLINFDRYVRFTERLNEVLHYSPPDLDQYRQQGQLLYLEKQLGNIQVDPITEETLMQRSESLEATESRDYRRRTHELRRLGFRTS